jgi:hypothetical protein
MPIVVSTGLSVKEPTITVGAVQLLSDSIQGTTVAEQTGDLVETLELKQLDTTIEAGSALILKDSELNVSGPLSLRDTALEVLGYLRDESVTINTKTPLSLRIGTVPFHLHPNKIVTRFFQIQSKHILFHRTPVALTDRFLRATGPAYLTSTGVSASGTLELLDIFGPQVFNEEPESWSSFNNPDSVITFDLIDTGGSDISMSDTEIHINGTPVIQAGADVTPSGFGTTTFSPVSTSYYQFQFISSTPFSPDSPVTVSGRSSDTTVSGNVEYFSYDFWVWKTGDLFATITGVADTFPPFVENLDPYAGEVEVPVYSDILLTVNDLHTGVDLSSIVLGVEGETVFSGSENASTDYTVSYTQTADGRGYNFTINPSSDFEFSQEVDVSIYAEDLFSPANTLDVSYSFNTIAHAHLIASGLQIYQDTAYESMEIASSYPTTSSTQFHITYMNLSGTGLSTSGSSVLLNGVEIPSTITPVSGNPYNYDVFFELSPDYTDDADLTFHVVQSGTVSGIEVYRDFDTELLWGYEFCYDNERLPYDTEMHYSVQVCDRADKPSLSALVKSFTTVPMDSQRMYASIVGIDPPAEDLWAMLTSNNTFFEYGKTMNLELEVADYSGNIRTFEWSFTIEDE